MAPPGAGVFLGNRPFMKALLRYLLISLTTVTPPAEVSDVILPYVLGGYWGSSGCFSNPPFFACLSGKNLAIIYFGSFLCHLS